MNEWAEYIVGKIGVHLATYRARIGTFVSGRNVNCEDQRGRKAYAMQWWRRKNVELVSNALSATSNDKFMTIKLSSWSRSLDIHVYHCAKNWIYAIVYFADISSLRIKNPTCGMNQFRTVHISSILNRITCA